MNYDLAILSRSNNLFLKKDVDTFSDDVVASIVTAAMEMSKFAEIPYTTEDTVKEELLDIYKKKDSEEVLELIGSAPQFVKNSIGFSVDFKDFNKGTLAYQADKESYDSLYQMIEKRKSSKERAKSL